MLREADVEELKVLFIDGLNVGSYLRDTLIADKITTQDEAILEIYRRLRPGRSAYARDGARPSSTTCSSTPSATTSRASAG